MGGSRKEGEVLLNRNKRLLTKMQKKKKSKSAIYKMNEKGASLKDIALLKSDSVMVQVHLRLPANQTGYTE